MEQPFDFVLGGHPIPRIFYDYVTEAPMEKCLMCGCKLLEAGTLYMIEKAVKGTDVLYEFAVCIDCSESSQQRVSEESAARIREFFTEQVDMQARAEELYRKYGGFDVDGWLEHCIVTGKSRSESKEYTLYGLFHNDSLLMGEFPFMISAEALIMVSNLLSKETKDEMGRFGDENLGVPPEFEDLFRKRTPVLL